MNEFRGKPFPGCVYHERPLMRCASGPVPGPAQATAFALSCPDCWREVGRGLVRTPRTPDIPITRAEFEALPAAPKPFGIGPGGLLLPLPDGDGDPSDDAEKPCAFTASPRRRRSAPRWLISHASLLIAP